MAEKVSRSGLKICCAVTGAVLLVMIIVMTTLAFTVFKPKDPRITATPTNIGDIIGSLKNGTLDVPLDMVVTIGNPNYGGFRFRNSTAYVYFQGDTVAQVPLQQDYVPAHGKINITATAQLMVTELISKPSFWEEVLGGSLGLTSDSKLHGKVDVLNIFKFGATAVTNCDITILLNTVSAETNCVSKIKL